MAGEARAREALQFLQVERGLSLRLCDGDHPLSPALVRYTDDDDVVDGWVTEQGRLHLLREDLLAPGVDAHRTAPVEDDQPVAVDARHVTREHPAHAVLLDEGRGRLLLVLVVTERDVTATGEIANAPVSRRERLERLVEDGGRLVHGEGGLVPRRRACRGQLATGDAGLRGPEAVGHHDVGQDLIYAGLRRSREDRASGRERRTGMDASGEWAA